MTARVAIVLMLLVAVAAGAGLYYAQVYAYYRDVPAEEVEPVTVVERQTGRSMALEVGDLSAIDSDSSPIRFRACFTTDLVPAGLAAAEPYPDPEPLVAPGWFGCFDAGSLGDMLEAGSAQAWLSQPDVSYGVDRVVAVAADGRGWLWHQINACGAAVFDGNPPPEGCPAPPEGLARR